MHRKSYKCFDDVIIRNKQESLLKVRPGSSFSLISSCETIGWDLGQTSHLLIHLAGLQHLYRAQLTHIWERELFWPITTPAEFNVSWDGRDKAMFHQVPLRFLHSLRGPKEMIAGHISSMTVGTVPDLIFTGSQTPGTKPGSEGTLSKCQLNGMELNSVTL